MLVAWDSDGMTMLFNHPSHNLPRLGRGGSYMPVPASAVRSATEEEEGEGAASESPTYWSTPATIPSR